MVRSLLDDEQWSRIAHLLPGKPTDKGGRAADNRLFVEAVLWIARTGSPWRDLPERFGRWHSVYMRFSRWETYGTWNRIAQVLAADADREEVFIDSTVVRAHQHAAGAQKPWQSPDERPSSRHRAGRCPHHGPAVVADKGLRQRPPRWSRP